MVSDVDNNVLLVNNMLERNLISDVTKSLSSLVISGVSENGNILTSENIGLSAVVSNGAMSDLDPKRLSETFDCSPDVALKTLKVTERVYPRNTTDISLNKRYPQFDSK